jgi:protein-tyrosine phosphatase
VVCTANVCRSPMAEALLRHHLATRDVDVTVTSAGTRAVDLPVDPVAVDALVRMGVDLADHRPRRLSREIIERDGADLVITMTREHLRDVAVTHRNAFARTFTLPELVRRASAAPASTPVDLSTWATSLGSGRRPGDLLRPDPDDDVDDPYGRGTTAVRATADAIDRMVRSLVDLAPWPRR